MADYTVPMETVCRFYEKVFYPSFIAQVPEQNRGDYAFRISIRSEADVLARAQFSDGSTNKARAIIAGGDEISGAVVSSNQELRFWDLRKFVTPPDAFAAYWREAADGERDPMLDVPPDLVKEIALAVEKRISEACRLLPDTAPAEAEAAAGK